MKKQEVSQEESKLERQSTEKQGLRRTSGMVMGPAEVPEDISHPPATEEKERTKQGDDYGQDCSS